MVPEILRYIDILLRIFDLYVAVDLFWQEPLVLDADHLKLDGHFEILSIEVDNGSLIGIAEIPLHHRLRDDFLIPFEDSFELKSKVEDDECL